MRRCEVINSDAAILDPATFDDDGGVELAGILEVEGPTLIACDSSIMLHADGNQDLHGMKYARKLGYDD